MPICPKCYSNAIEKIIAPPAVHFKGQGFYKTDTGTKPPKKEESEPKKESEKPKSEQKADSPKKSKE